MLTVRWNWWNKFPVDTDESLLIFDDKWIINLNLNLFFISLPITPTQSVAHVSTRLLGENNIHFFQFEIGKKLMPQEMIR